jgi:YVTN family beta-propeller protein
MTISTSTRGLALLGSILLTAPVCAQGPSAALLILNKEDATLSIVDPSNGQTRAVVPTGEGPHEVVASIDGTLAFVSNYGGQTAGSSLSVIDLSVRKERRIDLSPLRRPHGIWYADGKVYFTSETSRLVGRYDPVANKVDWMMGTGQAGTHMVMTNRDASKIFTTNIGSDSVTVMERGANPLAWSATVIGVGKGPEGFDVSPDGSQLWAAHSTDGGVSIVDLTSKKVVQTLDVQTKRSNRLKFTPDGQRVLISDLDAGDLVVIDAPARKEIKRLKLGRSPEGVLVVPDGSRAYVAVTGDNYVAAIDLKTLEVTGKISAGTGPDGMAWIPAR